MLVTKVFPVEAGIFIDDVNESKYNSHNYHKRVTLIFSYTKCVPCKLVDPEGVEVQWFKPPAE